MDKRRINEPPTGHAEGQHGPKTHAHLVQQLSSGPQREAEDDKVKRDRVLGAREGKRRLVEDRQQHDEAEKNSEHTQLHAEFQAGRALDGVSDNRGNLHGVMGNREHRAENQEVGPDGLRVSARGRKGHRG